MTRSIRLNLLLIVMLTATTAMSAGKKHRNAGPPNTKPPSSDKPTVVSTIPPNNAKDVDAHLTEIKVTYSKPMKDNSWSWCHAEQGTFPGVVDSPTATPHYEGDGRTCVLPVKLIAGQTYALSLNDAKSNDFMDAQGHPATPYLLVFRTADETARPASISSGQQPLSKGPPTEPGPPSGKKSDSIESSPTEKKTTASFDYQGAYESLRKSLDPAARERAEKWHQLIADRKWEDATGTHAIEAHYVNYDPQSKSLTIEAAGKRSIAISIGKLSETDAKVLLAIEVLKRRILDDLQMEPQRVHLAELERQLAQKQKNVELARLGKSFNDRIAALDQRKAKELDPIKNELVELYGRHAALNDQPSQQVALRPRIKELNDQFQKISGELEAAYTRVQEDMDKAQDLAGPNQPKTAAEAVTGQSPKKQVTAAQKSSHKKEPMPSTTSTKDIARRGRLLAELREKAQSVETKYLEDVNAEWGTAQG